MYKYLLTGFSALALLISYQVSAYDNYTYRVENERTIKQYGNFEDGMGAEDCPGTDEYFEAFMADEVNFDFSQIATSIFLEVLQMEGEEECCGGVLGNEFG